jgi:hypothetical protein
VNLDICYSAQLFCYNVRSFYDYCGAHGSVESHARGRGSIVRGRDSVMLVRLGHGHRAAWDQTTCVGVHGCCMGRTSGSM